MYKGGYLLYYIKILHTLNKKNIKNKNKLETNKTKKIQKWPQKNSKNPK